MGFWRFWHGILFGGGNADLDDARDVAPQPALVTATGAAAVERRDFVSDVEAWIQERKCFSYFELCRQADVEHPEWMSCIREHTTHLTAFMSSLEENIEQERKRRQLEQERFNHRMYIEQVWQQYFAQ